MKTAEVQVVRLGNSRAVLLPEEYARRAGIREGARLELQEAPDGSLSITRSRPFDRVAFVKKLKKLHTGMQVGESTVEQMRRDSRY